MIELRTINKTSNNEVLSKILDLWNKYAPRYKDSFGGVSMYKDFAEKMERSLLPVPGGVVLDGGCGPGIQFERIIQATKAKLLIGVDYAHEMVLRAKRLSEELNGRYDCEIRTANLDLLQKTPFPDNHFDGQVYHLVDYYLPFGRWKNLPKERFRIAKPGGFVVTANFLRQFDFRKEISGWPFIKEMVFHSRAIFWTILRARPILVQFQDMTKKGVLSYPTERELITIYNEAGFENVEVTERLWKDTGVVIRAIKPK